MRTAAVALCLFALSLTAHAQSCPVYPPFQPTLVNAQSCWMCAAPLDMTLAAALILPGASADAWPSYPIEPCDVVTFHFGDGTPDVTLTGAASTTHHYANPGIVEPTVTISNTLGTQTASLPLLLTATPAAKVSFSQQTYEVLENAGSITLPVQRTGNLSVTSTVEWTTLCFDFGPCGPGAVPPDDTLQNGRGTLVFAPGETSKAITLALRDDSIYSGLRYYFVYIRAFDGTFIGGFYSGQQPASEANCAIRLLDDDPPPVMTVADVTVPEKSSNARFTIRLSAPVGVNTEYDWFLTDGTAVQGIDYINDPDQNARFVTMPAGVTSLSFDVPILDNDTPNADKTFSVRVVPITAASPSVGRGTATCTILNDDFFVPASLNLSTGEHASLAFDAVTPFATATMLPIASSDPSIIEVPASIAIPAASSKASIDIMALHAGTAAVNVQVRGVAGQARILVSDPRAIVAQPSALNLRAGGDATVTLSIAPASASTKFLSIASSDPTLLQVPSSATVQPGGSADIAVHASHAGGGAIQVNDPGSGAMTSITVDVVSANAPLIHAVVPNVGLPAGGTRVILLGSNFNAPCAVSFGALAGTSVDAAGSELHVTSPAHPEGIVDLVVTCGSDQITVPNAFTFGRVRQRVAR